MGKTLFCWVLPIFSAMLGIEVDYCTSSFLQLQHVSMFDGVYPITPLPHNMVFWCFLFRPAPPQTPNTLLLFLKYQWGMPKSPWASIDHQSSVREIHGKSYFLNQTCQRWFPNANHHVDLSQKLCTSFQSSPSMSILRLMISFPKILAAKICGWIHDLSHCISHWYPLVN